MMEKGRRVSKGFYVLSITSFFASLFAGELMEIYHPFSRVSNILACLAFIFILCGSVFSLCKKVYTHTWIYVVFFFIASLFWNLSYCKCVLDLSIKEKVNAWSGLVGLNGSLLIWTFIALRERMKKGRALRLSAIWKSYVPLGTICVIFILLFLLNFDVWFHLDSGLYYSHIAANAGKWNFRFTDMRPFQMGGHTCYAYSILLTVGELLAPHLGRGQRAVNCVLSLAAIVSFYFITEKIWGKEKQLRSILLTVVFAFAPAFYGISYLVSTDFPLLCFFTLFLAASFYKISSFKFIMILCVCFSKEVGVFVMTGYYFGEVIAGFIREKRTVGALLRKTFDWKRLLMYSAAFLYALILFFGSGGWVKNFRNVISAPTDVEIPANTHRWWHYPIFKIFEYFVMNFNWLIWVLLLVAAVSIATYCRRNKKSCLLFMREKLSPYLDYYIPIIVTYIMFCLIGIAYLTYIHYRYIQLGHLFFVLCLGVIVDLIPTQTIKKELLMLPVAALMTIESFITIDPANYLFFKEFDAGNGKLVTTRQYWYITLSSKTGSGYYWEADEPTMTQHYLAEGTEYNRESIGLQRVLEKSLQRMGYSADVLVVLDMFGGWQSWTCAQLLGTNDVSGWYWDPDESTVVRYETEIPLNLAFDCDNLDALMSGYRKVYYIDFPFNQYHENSVLTEHPPIDSFSESHLRWKIDVYQLK